MLPLPLGASKMATLRRKSSQSESMKYAVGLCSGKPKSQYIFLCLLLYTLKTCLLPTCTGQGATAHGFPNSTIPGRTWWWTAKETSLPQWVAQERVGSPAGPVLHMSIQLLGDHCTAHSICEVSTLRPHRVGGGFPALLRILSALFCSRLQEAGPTQPTQP